MMKNTSHSSSAPSLLQAKIREINTPYNFSKYACIFRQTHLSDVEAIHNAISSLLICIGINDSNYVTYLEKEGDLLGAQNDKGFFLCDVAYNWVDQQYDLYDYDIWKNAVKFHDFATEAMVDLGFENALQVIKDGGLLLILEHVQYLTYTTFAMTVLELLSKKRED